MIGWLAAHPEQMYHLQPRKFEEVLAAIFRAQGYEVELTPASRDGGLDLRLVRKDTTGEVLTLVEAKRYSAVRRVQVGIVRSLYGVVEEQRASKGLVVTTSFFTKGARSFQRNLPYRLQLADFDNVLDWLKSYRRGAGR